METNFKLLDQIMDILNDKNSDEYRYLRDFKFFLQETERNIYLRKMMEASYTLRMCWDLSKQFIHYLIKNSDTQILTNWNKNLKAKFKSIEDSYKKRGKSYVQTTPGFGFLYEEYPSNIDQNVEGVGTTFQIVELFKRMNTLMHYNYDTNYKSENIASNKNDKSTLYLHRNEIRYNTPKMEQVIEYLKSIWLVTVDVISKSELFERESEIYFDSKIYDNPKYVLEKFMINSYVSKFINEEIKCPICGEGKFNRPDFNELMENDVKFPYGAYLSCDHETCWAKMDESLKIKKDIKEDDQCPSCRSENSLQHRVNLQEGNGRYVYKACRKCDWNNKASRVDEADEFTQNEIKRMEVFDWDEYYDE